MEDEKIIRLYLDRDESAISETAKKYGSRLRAVSYRITCDMETSEECENDTYMETWNRIPPSEPFDYFFAFLARIIRAASIDRCRERTSLKRSAYIAELTEELENCLPAGGDAEEALDAKLLGETISRYLLTLSDEKQLIFMRRYFYLDSISEISGKLSASESKIKMTLSRLRNGLREYLIGEGFTL